MLFKAISASVYGIDAYLVQVEVDVGTGRMEDFNVVGLPDNAVKESRIQTIAVPETNAKEAAVVDGIKVFALKSLPQAVDLINSPESFTSVTVDAEHMRAMVTLPFSSGWRMTSRRHLRHFPVALHARRHESLSLRFLRRSHA
jgi:hypothetical protein